MRHVFSRTRDKISAPRPARLALNQQVIPAQLLFCCAAFKTSLTRPRGCNLMFFPFRALPKLHEFPNFVFLLVRRKLFQTGAYNITHQFDILILFKRTHFRSYALQNCAYFGSSKTWHAKSHGFQDSAKRTKWALPLLNHLRLKTCSFCKYQKHKKLSGRG